MLTLSLLGLSIGLLFCKIKLKFLYLVF